MRKVSAFRNRWTRAPVFIPDRDPYALDATGRRPSTSGVVVTLLPGGKIVTFAALAVSTPSATTRWDLDPAAKWLAAETRRLRARRPDARGPAVCALPAATAAVAAAAAGADPAGVVGGVFVYGGFDGSAEMSDAHVLLRRVHGRRRRASRLRPAWEWIRVAATQTLPPPRAVAACAFTDAAALRRLGGGAGRLRDGRGRAHGRVRARRVRGSSRTSRRRRTFSKNAGALRNDLWRLDTSTFCWSCPEAIGDVPSPRRDAAVAVTPVSRSGLGRVFLHGGAAADGEPLADFYALDLGSLAWTRLPPGDQVLASDPYEAAGGTRRTSRSSPSSWWRWRLRTRSKRGSSRRGRSGEERKTRRAPPTQTPRRRRRGARVRPTRARARATPPRWWARRWSCTAACARAGRRCGPLETVRVRPGGVHAVPGNHAGARRASPPTRTPAPPADRRVGHGLFAHPGGTVLVGGGAAAAACSRRRRPCSR